MTNTYGKPPRPPRCTVQLIDNTRASQPKHVTKLTVYADAATVEKLIRAALEAAGLQPGGGQ